MNMNGTPSGYSQMGAQSSFSQMGSMMGMTPSMVDARSPHFVRGKAAVGRQTVTAPDLSKLGEDLALRALSADAELKRRLKAEQYGMQRYFKFYICMPSSAVLSDLLLAVQTAV